MLTDLHSYQCHKYISYMLAAALFTCTVASVTDGDTFRCGDGTRVRLQAIDAPEMNGCPKDRVCAPGNAQRSKEALTRLVLNKTLRCEPTGKSYSRVTAWCRLAGADVSCAMYRGNWAVRLAQFDRPRRLCRHRSLVPINLLPNAL